MWHYFKITKKNNDLKTNLKKKMISWVEIGMDLDDFLRLIYIENEKLIIITNRKKFIAKLL
jgi:hypothetical protein